MRLAMSVDEQIVNNNPQTPQPPQARSRLWRWLSTGLIVVGLLSLGAGGLMAYRSLTVVAEPPPPVGAVEPAPSLEENPLPVLAESSALESAPPSLEDNPLPVLAESSSAVDSVEPSAPPSLEENPLPVVSEGKLQDTRAIEAPSSPSASSPSATDPSDLVSEVSENGSGADPRAIQEAEQDVPSGPPPTPAPAPVLAAETPPTRVVIPAIDLDTDVVSVGWKKVTQGEKLASVWEVAEFAAGWHQNSALPGGGGNVVVSGHHNVKGEVFRYIVDLNPGDSVTLYADGQPYTYEVESRFVLRDKGMSEEQRRENASWIGSFPDERLTLVTCWPYTNNTHRVIVVAKPTE
jgi:sortase A